MFQSPRSGKFVSENNNTIDGWSELSFNPLDRGKFVSDSKLSLLDAMTIKMFQSPRSGKFVLDFIDRKSGKEKISVSIP